MTTGVMYRPLGVNMSFVEGSKLFVQLAENTLMFLYGIAKSNKSPYPLLFSLTPCQIDAKTIGEHPQY